MDEIKKRDRGLVIFLGLIFLFLAYKVYDIDHGVLFDNSILEALHRETNVSLFMASKFISFLGSAYVIAGLILVMSVYYYRKNNYYFIKLLAANTILSYLINFLLKQLIHRIRPVDFFRIDYFGYSFPSGHSMINMSLWLTIAYIISREGRNKKLIYPLTLLYIGAMGFSRLYLGVHWPTDIIGGFIMGYIVYKISKEKIPEN